MYAALLDEDGMDAGVSLQIPPFRDDTSGADIRVSPQRD
jgi:hypothetical protein